MRTSESAQPHASDGAANKLGRIVSLLGALVSLGLPIFGRSNGAR